jgi:hypothetical protein
MADLKPPSEVFHELYGQETNMKFNLVVAAAVAATAFTTHVLPQADIEEPGHCAQFYLNAKCQNVGPGKPYTDGVYYHDDPAQTAEPNVHHYHGGPK